MDVKYRSLTSEELEELEKEFVEYLVANGITAEEWVRLKKQEPKKAARIIDLFSDVVFEGIFRKTQFLIHVSADRILTFQALEENIILVGVEDSSTSFDFTQSDMLERLQSDFPKGLKIYQQEKTYQKQREVELFEMVQNGAQIVDGNLYKQLSMLYATMVM